MGEEKVVMRTVERDVAELAARVVWLEDYMERNVPQVLHRPDLSDTAVPLVGQMSGGFSAQIHVHYDKILVRRAPEREAAKFGSSIAAPESAREKPLEGEVLAVGNGRITPTGIIPLRLQVGDSVIFGRYSGVEVDLGPETFLVLREDEILASVRTAPPESDQAQVYEDLGPGTPQQLPTEPASNITATPPVIMPES